MTKKRRQVQDLTDDVVIRITKKHEQKANAARSSCTAHEWRKRCATQCVYAQGALGTGLVKAARIGERVSKILGHDNIIRIGKTSERLAFAIKEWDSGKPWPFPAGRDYDDYVISVPKRLVRTPEQIEKQRQRDAQRLLKIRQEGGTGIYDAAGTLKQHKTLGRVIGDF